MSLGRAVATVGGFTLLSRVVGFIRDVVLSAVLGSGAVADAFFVAFKLPNSFAACSPKAPSPPPSCRCSRANFRTTAAPRRWPCAPGPCRLAAGPAALLAGPDAGHAAGRGRVLAPGLRDEPTFAMAVTFGRITFPYLLFISLASLYGGVLNSIDRFAMSRPPRSCSTWR